MSVHAGQFELQFDDAQWAVTPGQSAVLYDGDVCLGGGVIAATQADAPQVHGLRSAMAGG